MDRGSSYFLSNKIFLINPTVKTHPAVRRRSDVVMTSLWTFQQRRRYVSNETPNNVCRQDVSVVPLYKVLLEHRDDVSVRRNKDVPSVRLQDVSSKSQMEHPTASQWLVTKTSQCYVSTTSY